MKITARELKRIIAEEIRKASSKKVIQEGTKENPVKITAEYLNRIIKEEYEAFNRRQRLAEARRRRVRARRLAEARRSRRSRR